MYKADLDRHLRGDFPFKSFFFYGQSHFLIDYYEKQIIAKIDERKESDVKSVFFEEYASTECQTYLSQSSLFGGKNILSIKLNAKIDAKELKALLEICSNNANAYLIVSLHAIGLDYQKEKRIVDGLNKEFSKQQTSATVRFFKPFLKEATDILAQRAKEINLPIAYNVVKYLYENQHEHLEFAYNELDKLALLQTEITYAIIDEHSSNLALDEYEEIFVHLLEKKPFLDELKKLLEHTLKEAEILRLFSDFVLNLILFNIYIKDNGCYDSKAILGVKLPKNIEEKRAKLAIRYKLPTYLSLLNALQELEHQIKGNIKTDTHVFLCSCFARFQKQL